MPKAHVVVGSMLASLLVASFASDAGAFSRFHPEVTPVCHNPSLAYIGGPIMQDPLVIAVMWSSNVNSSVQTSMAQFYGDVGQSPYLTWLQEYDTVGIANGTEQAIVGATSGGTVVLTPSRCGGTTTCTVTDAQVQTELLAQIAAGKLPAPTVDCSGNANTIYMISFPANVTVSGPDGAGSSCNSFCAYHNTGTYGASTPLVYGILMDEFTSECKSGCGSNTTALQNTTETASHELVEAITDPDIGLLPASATAIAKPVGWYDTGDNQCGEIADICDTGGAGDTITVSGRTWTVQEVWSNKQGKCTSTGTVTPICSGTTTTGCRKCACVDNGVACGGSTSVCETTSSNVLFGSCEQCTSASATACGAEGTCTQSTTAAQDDVCSAGCVALTACPTGQDCGIASDGCGATINCGTCSAPETCGAGGVANQCGCAPATTCSAGNACGTQADGCRGEVSCGTCSAGSTCSGNQCVTSTVDAGVDAAKDAGGGATDATVAADGALDSTTTTTSDGPLGGHDGSIALDAGTIVVGTDSGGLGPSGSDSGGIVFGNDAGTIAFDAATGDAGDAGDGAAGNTGGCGCRVAGEHRGTSSSVPAGAVGGLALLGVLRIRRRRSRG